MDFYEQLLVDITKSDFSVEFLVKYLIAISRPNLYLLQGRGE